MYNTNCLKITKLKGNGSGVSAILMAHRFVIFKNCFQRPAIFEKMHHYPCLLSLFSNDLFLDAGQNSLKIFIYIYLDFFFKLGVVRLSNQKAKSFKISLNFNIL